MKYLNFLLIFIPLAIISSLFEFDTWLVFASAALGVIPLAGILGRATEELALHAGPQVGGLLNATLGNAAELIITFFAIREGLLELAKASITGSISSFSSSPPSLWKGEEDDIIASWRQVLCSNTYR